MKRVVGYNKIFNQFMISYGFKMAQINGWLKK